MEADFQRFYGINLPAEVFERQMPMRRFMVLVRGLPADSAWAYFINDDEGRDLVNSKIYL